MLVHNLGHVREPGRAWKAVVVGKHHPGRAAHIDRRVARRSQTTVGVVPHVPHPRKAIHDLCRVIGGPIVDNHDVHLVQDGLCGQGRQRAPEFFRAVE